ncbi:MAG: TaqI-like C-terminal specificity domain-containing protein, partial [bacterium]
IIKPILRGRDIKRYYYEWAGLWVIFIPWHFPLHEDISIQGASEKAEKEFQKKYPAIYNHLLEFKDQLSKRNKEETGIRYEWYALQRCAATYYPEFEKEKVVWAETDQNLNTVIVPKEMYLQKTCFMIITDKPKIINGLLNSQISQWYIGQKSPLLGEKGMSLTKESVKEIPLPPITPSNEALVKRIEELVDEILAAKKQAPQADTSEWEREIDEIVYKLYD